MLFLVNYPNIFIAHAVFLPPKSGQNKMAGVLSQVSNISFLGSGLLQRENETDLLEILKAFKISRRSVSFSLCNKPLPKNEIFETCDNTPAILF